MSGFRPWPCAASTLAATLMCSTPVFAQPLAMTEPGGFPSSVFRQVLPEPAPPPQETATEESSGQIAAHLRRQVVAYPTPHAPSTVVIDTANTYLYYVLGGGRAIRYGIGVGREGFTWSGVQSVSRKQEWPDWRPPAEMIARQPYLPRYMAGGPGNPLGARALYLGSSMYRVHGTNQPSSIGQKVSSGCIRLLNEDVIDLYNRVSIGTKVVVLPDARRTAPTVVARAARPEPAAGRTRQPVEPLRATPQPDTWSFAGAPLHYGSSASRLY